jgi:hypothetical protein
MTGIESIVCHLLESVLFDGALVLSCVENKEPATRGDKGMST